MPFVFFFVFVALLVVYILWYRFASQLFTTDQSVGVAEIVKLPKDMIAEILKYGDKNTWLTMTATSRFWKEILEFKWDVAGKTLHNRWKEPNLTAFPKKIRYHVVLKLKEFGLETLLREGYLDLTLLYYKPWSNTSVVSFAMDFILKPSHLLFPLLLKSYTNLGSVNSATRRR